VRFGCLIAMAAPLLLELAVATGAQAKGGPITIHVKAVNGQPEFSYRGKKLTASKFDQLCATAHKQKRDIEFKKDKMNSSDTVSSILGEARCLGATHIGFTGVDHYK
jgi:hypothetical protein